MSGCNTRLMGRPDKDASPVKAEKKGCAARSPIMSRSVVPEFPASSTVSGSRSPCSPFPVTSSSCFEINSICTPRARMTPTVERQSAAYRKFFICTGVRPSPENITLRCEMDLSPGTATIPTRPCRAGSTVFTSVIYLTRFLNSTHYNNLLHAPSKMRSANYTRL